ncbi:MAG TPA: NADH-quinone oxidoreductase subunit NuoG [Acidimicrobiales bacterium]|nr:NADH-quinone oxidoreductase subunit NuoG [Acidimicrobiales bacterium]
MSDAPADATAETTVTVKVNGKEIQARKGELVIDAAERNGTYIPRFCYHNRMRPVGMCRMCIVEIDTGRGPALQPSCMIECTDGMSVETDSEVTKKAQDGILEFLLINHPLDCPVCDKGGECPLQDQTLSHGPGESRFVEEKRHLEKPINISDLVLLDRERCILCDRCTRFAKEVAGDPLIHFQGRGYDSEINTFPDHPFASYFSGNTVQICPVGALTSVDYRFRARPWDLEQVESTCTTCSVGCRVTIDSSRNRVLRYNGVDSDPVNHSWMCDKGRYDFQYLTHEDRLTDPLARPSADADLAEVRWVDALSAAADAIREGLDRSGPSGVAVLGGARLANEDAYAWAKLAKGVIGTDNVDAQLGDGLPADVVLGLPRATIDDVCRPGGTVIVLSGDVKEELPVLYLRLRHAAVEDGVTFIELAQGHTNLTQYAAASLVLHPGEAAEVARALVASGPLPEGVDAAALEAARTALAAADGPVTVILGRPNIAESADAVVAAARVLSDGIEGVRFLPALRRGNVMGAIELGLAPGMLPGRVSLADGRDWFAHGWKSDNVPTAAGLDARGILQAAADGKIDTLVLLGADPIADFPDRDLAERALAGARTVIAVDLFLTDSSGLADIVLPAAGYAEASGTTTNLEGRVTRLERKVSSPGTTREDWMIAAELAFRLGADMELESVAGIWDEITRLSHAHEGLTAVALDLNPDGLIGPRPLDADDPGAGRHFIVAGGVSPIGGAEAAERAEALTEAENVREAEGAAEDDEYAELASYGRQAASEAPNASPGAAAGPAPARPAPVTWTDRPTAEAPKRDAYSLRLVAERKLYDHGVLVRRSGSLAGLAAERPLRVNPYDFERLGVGDGATVRVSSAKGSSNVALVADHDVPRGVAVLTIDQSTGLVGQLVDAGESVCDVRVETTS